MRRKTIRKSKMTEGHYLTLTYLVFATLIMGVFVGCYSRLVSPRNLSLSVACHDGRFENTGCKEGRKIVSLLETRIESHLIRKLDESDRIRRTLDLVEKRDQLCEDRFSVALLAQDLPSGTPLIRPKSQAMACLTGINNLDSNRGLFSIDLSPLKPHIDADEVVHRLLECNRVCRLAACDALLNKSDTDLREVVDRSTLRSLCG